jgi:hypothetical protein
MRRGTDALDGITKTGGQRARETPAPARVDVFPLAEREIGGSGTMPRVFLKRGEGNSRYDKGGLAQLRASALELGTAERNGSNASQHESTPASSTVAAPSRPAASHSHPRAQAQQHRRPERLEQQQGFHALEESIRRQTEGCWPSAQAAPDPLGGGASAPRQGANAEAPWTDAGAGHAGNVAGWCLGSTGEAPGDEGGDEGGSEGGGAGGDESGVLPCAQHARDAAHPAAAWLGGSAAVSATFSVPPPAAAAAATGGGDWQPTWSAAAAGDGSGGGGGGSGGGGGDGGGIADMFSLAAAGGGGQDSDSDGGGNDGGWRGGGGGGGESGTPVGWPAAAAAASVAGRGGGGGAAVGGDVAAAYCQQLTRGAGGATYDDDDDDSWDLPPVSATSLSPQPAFGTRAAVAGGHGNLYGGAGLALT